MQTSTISFVTAVLGLAASAQALGQAKVINNCPFDVSVWSVGAAIAGPWRLAANGGSYGETFVRDPTTGGKALKVTIPADGLFTGAPQSDFAYSLDGARIWYDLSDVFGDPFAGHKLVVSSTSKGCGTIIWPNGTPPAGSQVKVCDSANDVDFVLCSV
jgi:hypothetical protein